MMTDRQLHHLSRAYGITFTEREMAALTAPAGLLGRLDKQHAFLLERALLPVPCPACHRPTCLRAAAQHVDPASGHGANDEDYACPRCQAKLRYNLSVIGEQWFTLRPGQTIILPGA